MCPGLVETEGTHATELVMDEFRANVEAVTPLGRIGQPQDIALAVSYLASDDALWVTGTLLTVAGGY